MKKIVLLASVAMLATSPAFAGSLSAGTEEADPYVAPDEDNRISPLLIGLGAAGIIGAVILLADSNSSSGGTTAMQPVAATQ